MARDGSATGGGTWIAGAAMAVRQTAVPENGDADHGLAG
jgi:hypothetical protein